MVSFQALPTELVRYIIDLLIDCDVASANSLLQTCRAFVSSKYYGRIRYLNFWAKSFFPSRKMLPRFLELESDLLQQNTWPKKGYHDSIDGRGEKCSSTLFRWHKIPIHVQISATRTDPLSGAARLIGDTIYDISQDGLSLFAQDCITLAQRSLKEHQRIKNSVGCNFKFLTLRKKILSYDVDLDENIIVLLLDQSGRLSISVRSLEVFKDVVIEEELSSCLDDTTNFNEVIVNGDSILISIGNHLQVFKWKEESSLCLIWNRRESPAEMSDQTDKLYIRGFLLSSEVVARIVMYTSRTFGSIRVSRGAIELYRLDQYNPKVADITLSEMSIDALQPRYLQDPYRYINIDLGGRRSLSEYRRTLQDRPMMIQTFSETRIGGISSLADILYPRSALALYSESHPVLGREWLRGNYTVLSDPSPLQSSLHGNRMLSCSKRGKKQLIYWDLYLKRPTYSSLEQVAAVEDMNQSLHSHFIDEEGEFHIDHVCIDGPRALLTCYKFEYQHNGTVQATRPMCSFWTELQAV